MKVLFIVLAVVVSALGACARFVMMEYGRASVVLVNALASFAMGACAAGFGVQAASQPAQQLSLGLAIAFLAGFSTVSGQVGWVYQRETTGWRHYGLILGLVLMAAGLGWLGFGVVQWLA